MALVPNTSGIGLSSATGIIPFPATFNSGTDINVEIYAFTINGDLVTAVDLDGTISATFSKKLNTRGTRFMYTYILSGVTPGSHTINVHTTGTPGRTECAWVVRNGAVQSTTPDNTQNIASGTANPYVMTMTTIADNCFVTACVDTGNSGGAGTNTTKLEDNTPTGALILYDNSGVAPVHPAGSATLNATNASAGQNIAMMTSMAPFISTATNAAALMALL